MSTASHLSKVYVKVPVSAIESGSVVDVTTATVRMAFPEVGVDPESGDWTTASWETDATRDPDRYYARCLTGPGGDVELEGGKYDPWVEITGITPEIPVIKASSPHTVT